MSGLALSVTCAVGFIGLAVAALAWFHGRVIGERDEARRMLRWVDPEEQTRAIREAILAGPTHGTQPPRWPE